MPIIVPIQLSNAVSNVLQIICLHPLSPEFQPGVAPANFSRDTSAISFGFPFSIDTPYDGIDLTSASASATGSDLPGVYPIPPNAYAILLPSEIYNNNQILDSQFGILLLDVTVCPVQPGLSRLRIDYVSNRTFISPSGNDNVTVPVTVTDYLDMPFWEAWDNHPSLINSLVALSEQTVDFLQSEINVLSKDLQNNLNKAQTRGLHLSGTFFATQALQLNNLATSAQNPVNSQQKFLQQKFTEYHALPSKIDSKFILPKSTNYPYIITSISPDNGIFPGQTITITTNVSMQDSDQIYLASYPLPSVVNGNTITAVIPTTITFGLTINLTITGQNVQKTDTYALSIFNQPNITTINGVSKGFIVPGASFTLYGKNFGSTQGNTFVLFNNDVNPATLTSWSENVITGIVPLDAISGPVLLTTDAGAIATIIATIVNDNELDVFTISPNVASIQPSETIQFIANVNGTAVNANWSIITDSGNIGNGDLAHGFIDANGNYTPPSTVPTSFNLSVAANHTRYYGNLYQTASLLVLAQPNAYVISPNTVILEPSFTQPFELLGVGGEISNVTWYVNGFGGGTTETGTINYQGLYQAPTIIPNTGTVNVTGVGAGGSATAVVSIVGVGTTSLNNITGNQSHDIESKDFTGPSCCLAPITNVYDATVGTTLLITDFSTANGENVDSEGNVYYVTGFLQSDCGNQDGNLYVGSGGTLNNYGLISYTPQSSGFASIQVFSTVTSIVNNSPVVTGGYSTIVINIVPAPTPILNRISSGCPGQNVIVTGQNFPPDAQVVFSSNNQLLPTVVPPNTSDGLNYSMTVTIPFNTLIALTEYEVQITSSYSSSSNIGILTIPASCSVPSNNGTLVLLPQSSTTYNDGTVQFAAILQFTDGTEENVSSSSLWYVENTRGGNSTLGTITTTGLYTAPNTTPISPSGNALNNLIISAVYVNNNQITQVNSYVTIVTPMYSPVAPVTANPPTSSVGSCCLLTVSPNLATATVPGSPIQFQANFSVNGGANTIVAAQWSVNGVVGGNAMYGTIDGTGLYTPPAYYIPRYFSEIPIGASFTYTATGGSAIAYTGYSVLSFNSITTQSGICEIVLVNQLNLFFGDGRFGYLPAETTIYVPAGYYLYVTYQQTLDEDFIPIGVNSSQLLTYGVISAQSSNLSTVLYNQGTIVSDTNNDGGTYLQPITIPLGLVDPTSGYFQSMWDMIPVIIPTPNVITPQPIVCSLSHDFHENTSKDNFNITAHINNRFENKPSIEIPNKIMFVGKANYQNEKLTINRDIQSLTFDQKTKTLVKSKVNNKKSINCKENQVLIATLDQNKWNLNVINVGDTLPEGLRTYVLGVVADKFYSLWPLLDVKNDFISKFTSPKTTYIKFGNVIMQWGVLEHNQITFEIPFESSYSLQTDATILKRTLNGFEYSIINQNQINRWFAFGV